MQKTTTPPGPTPVRPFVDTLRELRGGNTIDDLSRELHKLVDAVQQTQRGGELVLRLKVKPSTTAQGRAAPTVTVEDAILTKMPNNRTGSTLFFVTDEANLSRDNPRQPDLPLEVVGGANPTAARG